MINWVKLISNRNFEKLKKKINDVESHGMVVDYNEIILYEDTKLTPLIYASKQSNIGTKIFKYLLSNGASPYTQDEEGHSAAYFLLRNKRYKCLQILINDHPNSCIMPNHKGLFIYDIAKEILESYEEVNAAPKRLRKSLKALKHLHTQKENLNSFTLSSQSTSSGESKKIKLSSTTSLQSIPETRKNRRGTGRIKNNNTSIEISSISSSSMQTEFEGLDSNRMSITKPSQKDKWRRSCSSVNRVSVSKDTSKYRKISEPSPIKKHRRKTNIREFNIKYSGKHASSTNSKKEFLLGKFDIISALESINFDPVMLASRYHDYHELKTAIDQFDTLDSAFKCDMLGNTLVHYLILCDKYDLLLELIQDETYQNFCFHVNKSQHSPYDLIVRRLKSSTDTDEVNTLQQCQDIFNMLMKNESAFFLFDVGKDQIEYDFEMPDEMSELSYVFDLLLKRNGFMTFAIPYHSVQSCQLFNPIEPLEAYDNAEYFTISRLSNIAYGLQFVDMNQSYKKDKHKIKKEPIEFLKRLRKQDLECLNKHQVLACLYVCKELILSDVDGKFIGNSAFKKNASLLWETFIEMDSGIQNEDMQILYALYKVMNGLKNDEVYAMKQWHMFYENLINEYELLEDDEPQLNPFIRMFMKEHGLDDEVEDSCGASTSEFTVERLNDLMGNLYINEESNNNPEVFRGDNRKQSVYSRSNTLSKTKSSKGNHFDSSMSYDVLSRLSNLSYLLLLDPTAIDSTDVVPSTLHTEIAKSVKYNLFRQHDILDTHSCLKKYLDLINKLIASNQCQLAYDFMLGLVLSGIDTTEYFDLYENEKIAVEEYGKILSPLQNYKYLRSLVSNNPDHLPIIQMLSVDVRHVSEYSGDNSLYIPEVLGELLKALVVLRRKLSTEMQPSSILADNTLLKLLNFLNQSSKQCLADPGLDSHVAKWNKKIKKQLTHARTNSISNITHMYNTKQQKGKRGSNPHNPMVENPKKCKMN